MERVMRRDFDYVTMDDYARDMQEQSDAAASALEIIKRERDETRRLLAEVVLAAGGKVSVPDRRRQDTELLIARDEANMARTIVARKAR